jgi:hypothetical protein
MSVKRQRLMAACSWQLVLCGTCAVLSAGCGTTDGAVPVSGNVTFRGQPLSNASITFYPASGRPVSAAITEGEYGAQLQPSDYKVTVSLGVDLPPGWKEGDPVPPRDIVLPERYSSMLHTQLSANVNEDQSEPIDFKLE